MSNERGIRQTKFGKFELTVHHKALPKGRKYFTFDTLKEATDYRDQWDLLVKAGLPPPQELLRERTVVISLGAILRDWANCGEAAPSEQPTIKLLIGQIGLLPFSKFTLAWAEQWIQKMKTGDNLAPGTIKKRVGALERAIDRYIRKSHDIQIANPLKSLPDGYAQYNERDRALVLAANKEVREDISRDRRLVGDEDARIQAAALLLDFELWVLYMVIVNTGLRLKEAYMLRVENVNFKTRTIKVQKSKQWRGKVAYKEVPMAPPVFKALEEFLKGRTPGLVFSFWNEDPETHRTASTKLSKRFAVLYRHAKCEEITEHDLRHEATCRWFEMRGKDGQWLFRPEEINKIMGWTPGSPMAQRYASFRGESLADRLWA